MTNESTKTEVGSYFISNYPPFSQWSADQLGEVRDALQTPPAEVPLGLYLHIPFCRKRCKFCYFKVFTDKNSPEVERYLAALSHEIELVSKLPVMGERTTVSICLFWRRNAFVFELQTAHAAGGSFASQHQLGPC